MPDVEDPGRTPRKCKEHPSPGQHAKQVHFETTNGGGKQSYPPPPQASSAPNSPGGTHAAPPGKPQQKTSSKAAPVDNQPTSFPQVGAPPGQFGPGQWYTSADPRMSLNQPQQYYQQPQPQYHLPPNGGGGGGYWQQPGVPVFANGAPAGTHFYPTAVPPHYAAFNNICHPQPAYSAMPVGQPGYVIAQQPAMLAQPMTPGQQPVYIAGQAPPGMMQGAPQPFMSCGGGIPVIAGNSGNPPDVSGLGRTQGEETLRQLQFAHANKLFEPQEFKPADDDPSRFYYVREVDGNWTQRNRFTIDHMGDCRWYVTDEGWFYAVRLPD